MLKYSKEIVTVSGNRTAPSKFILAFPLLDFPPGDPLPETITLSKPCQLLWSFSEMPHVFVFTIDAGTEVWSKDAKLVENHEVAFAFDIIWQYSLAGEYKRISKAEAQLVG